MHLIYIFHKNNRDLKENNCYVEITPEFGVTPTRFPPDSAVLHTNNWLIEFQRAFKSQTGFERALSE